MRAHPGRLVLLGHPVTHSLSPAFQNAALKAAAIPLRYEAIDVAPEELHSLAARLRAAGAAGNVTVPHKESFARLCDSLTPAAELAGAVNCFDFRGGTRVGHNTDVAGFAAAAAIIRGGGDPSGTTVGVFGAGGAAAAVLAAAGRWPGVRCLVVNRDVDRARRLCARFGDIARESDAETVAREADLVVNATSLGLRGEPGPIDPALLRHDAAVLDLVYAPDETPFVRAARQAGRRSADGLAMLVHQGAEAFAWWFGVRPDLEVMWRATGRDVTD